MEAVDATLKSDKLPTPQVVSKEASRSARRTSTTRTDQSSAGPQEPAQAERAKGPAPAQVPKKKKGVEGASGTSERRGKSKEVTAAETATVDFQTELRNGRSLPKAQAAPPAQVRGADPKGVEHMETDEGVAQAFADNLLKDVLHDDNDSVAYMY